MRAAVDRLIDYDARRRTSLLDTLERYLAERRSVIESARELFIHPNTLRQRLGRIEELTGLNLDEDDLLSLELAIKLARLHGGRRGGGAPAGVGRRVHHALRPCVRLATRTRVCGRRQWQTTRQPRVWDGGSAPALGTGLAARSEPGPRDAERARP